jgi:hypothetical protein
MAIKLKKNKLKERCQCVGCKKFVTENYDVTIGFVDMTICKKCMEKIWEKINEFRNREIEKILGWMLE